MIGWLILALIAVVSLFSLYRLGLRGPMLQLAVAAVFVGSAGYALQGHPGIGGSPRSERSEEPPPPLTKIRQAFFGQFTSAESWLRISEALASRGNSEDAVGALKSAVREHPGDVQLWVGLGNALVDHAGVLTPAAEYSYRRAAELAPGHPAPVFFMGLALARSGQGQAAVAIWTQMLADSPADAEWRPLVEDAVAALRPRP